MWQGLCLLCLFDCNLCLFDLFSLSFRYAQFTGGLSAAPVKLCDDCIASGECVSCRSPAAEYAACLCKSCKVKAVLCAKCGNKASETEHTARLCRKCGVGSSAQLCCKMIIS